MTAATHLILDKNKNPAVNRLVKVFTAGDLPAANQMKSFHAFLLASVLLTPGVGLAEELAFHDHFQSKLQDGWSWVREDAKAWRTTRQGLEVRIQPGNMWGGANDAKNVLVRSLPDSHGSELEIAVTVTNRPTEQYEQVDLVWYYDDSHMVKLGQELVDGKLSIVMGREEADKTKTISITPLDVFLVELRLSARGDRIRGFFRTTEMQAWQPVGECQLPARGFAKASLQFYNGSADLEHWARVTDFRILCRDAQTSPASVGSKP